MPSKSFVFHEEWKETLSGLPQQVRLEVYDAIIEYGISGTLTELKAMAELAFNIIRNCIDNDRHRIENIRRKRSEAGRKHKGNQYSLKNGTNGTSVPNKWNKCSKTSINKGVSEDSKNGTSVPNASKKEEKATFPPAPLFLEKEENNTQNTRTREELTFDTFWNAYGYKKSKPQALKAWNKLSDKDKKAAMDAIEPYKRDCAINGRNMKYPATYLNGQTWEDDFNNNGYGATNRFTTKPSHADYVAEAQDRLLRNIPRPNVTTAEE